MKKVRQLICILVASFLMTTPVSAAMDAWTLKDYALNQIYFITDGADNHCTSGGDCYIAGDSWDERMWSALRHVGFTPEQTAGLIGNIVHEGGTPTTQEYVYIDARNNGCKTAEGKPYDIHTDIVSDGVHHGSCIGGYSAGSEVVGIGLGPVQWTSHGRREGYLEKMGELGLSKYFEGDAYKKYGKLSDEQLRETIKSETGSENDYWALWCAAIKFIWTEMQCAYKGFFSNSSVRDYASWASASYEACSACAVGASQHSARIASAEDYWKKYQNGDFSSVEDGSAASLTGSSSSGGSHTSGSFDDEDSGGVSSSKNGANVTIIGDSITNGSRAAIEADLPKAEIIAQDSKHFAGSDGGNPSGLQIVEQLKSEGKLRPIVVIALGTNDGLTKGDIDEMVKEIGSDRQIFFVTNYDIIKTSKYNNNNKLLAAAEASYDNVKVIDWKNAVLTATGSPSDYVKDEGVYAVHPTAEGQKLFAKTIKEGISGVKPSDTCVDEGTNGELTFYYQNDEPWGSKPYGSCGTIGEAGCGPTSLAMIITALSGKKVTPDEIAKKAAARGYRVCGSGSSHAITDLAKDYGLSVKDYGRPSIGEINKALKDRVMFQVAGFGPNPFSGIGHFIGIRGITDDGKWLIFDSSHKGTDNNTKAWDPSAIYPHVSSDWRGVSKK